jgi:hypothetical protein
MTGWYSRRLSEFVDLVVNINLLMFADSSLFLRPEFDLTV